MKKQQYQILYLAIAIIILAISLIFTGDRFTWILEVFPILIGLPVLIITHRKFPLTDFLYVLLIVHFSILATGGVYTYEKVPLGYWMQDIFGFSRNHYDRIGHFAQGFIPAILTREVLLRTSPLRRGKWLFFIVIAICLACSAFYELIEWRAAVTQGASADAFLGSQGDPWDAQWDMFMALIGSFTALITLSGFHDKKIAEFLS